MINETILIHFKDNSKINNKRVIIDSNKIIKEIIWLSKINESLVNNHNRNNNYNNYFINNDKFKVIITTINTINNNKIIDINKHKINQLKR